MCVCVVLCVGASVHVKEGERERITEEGREGGREREKG